MWGIIVVGMGDFAEALALSGTEKATDDPYYVGKMFVVSCTCVMNVVCLAGLVPVRAYVCVLDFCGSAVL